MRTALNGLGFSVVTTLPAAASNSGVIMQGPNGILFFSNGTAWLPLNSRYPASASVSTSSGLNTVETYISAAFPIPANTLTAGMAFRIKAFGTCTSSVAKTSTFTVRLGTAGTTADTSVLAATATSSGSGTSIPFMVEAIVTIRSIGSGGTAVASVALVNTGITGVSTTATVVVGAGTTAAVNTTLANFLGISYLSSGSTTTCTFNQVTVEQLSA